MKSQYERDHLVEEFLLKYRKVITTQNEALFLLEKLKNQEYEYVAFA